MVKTYIKIFLLTFLFLQPLSYASAGIVERNHFLTQMASLAEKPKQYIILNIDEGKISLMIRGVILREWKIDQVSMLGESIPLKPFPLISKSVQLSQLRRNDPIDDDSVDNASDKSAVDKSPDNKTSTEDKSKKKYEFIALELGSMPTDYQLFFDDGITINVKSKVEGYKADLKDKIDRLKSYLYSPIRAIWPSHDEKKSTKIDMIFKDKTEAQALFWAFTEGTNCLFLPRNAKDKEDFRLVDMSSGSANDKGKTTTAKDSVK
jgi:hypothetical protein